jgi:hypothetical protein
MTSVISIENLSKKYIIGHPLNGEILGMSKAEIKSKFDAIVIFAEVKKTLDTFVKYFSKVVQLKLAASYGLNPISYPVGSESPSGFHPQPELVTLLRPDAGGK